MMAETQQATGKDTTSGIVKRAIQVLLAIAIQGAILFAAAGTLKWWEAWAYVGIYVGGVLINSVFMLRRSPETIAERAEGASRGGWKDWDKVIGLIFALFYFIGILLVAGLDERWQWTGPINMWAQIAGFGLFCTGWV